MISTELKATLNKETIWIVAETIKQGCAFVRKAEQETAKQEELELNDKPFDYTVRQIHYDSMRATAEILWRLFKGYSAAVQRAIEKVSEVTNEYTDEETYFDKFIEAYEKEYGMVELRIFQ